MVSSRLLMRPLTIVLRLIAIVAVPTSLVAQQHHIQPLCQTGCGGGGTYGVEVGPDGDSSIVAWNLVNTTNHHVTYTVTNIGTLTDTYEFFCTSSYLTCTNVSPSSLTLDPSEQSTVTVTYSTTSAVGNFNITLTGASEHASNNGYYTVEVVDPPIVTVASPGTGARVVVHNRQPVFRATFLPRSSVMDTTTTVLTFRGDTVSRLARHGKGLIEWEVDSTRWLRTGLPGFSGVDSALASIRTCGLAGFCDTQTQWIVLPADSTPVLGFTGMPLENLGGGFSAPFGGGISVAGGEVETGVAIPSYVSMGVARSAGLVYSTRQSFPRALVNVDLDLPWPTSTPTQVKLVLSEGVVHLDSLTLTGSAASCLTGSVRRCRASLQAEFTGTNPSTVMRKWLTVTAAVTSGTTTKMSADSVEVVVEDRRASHYGSGWWPAGISQLVQAGSDRIVVGATGAATIYRGNGDSLYIPSPGNGTALVRTASGWELRPRGSLGKVVFNGSGQLVRSVDLSGNRDSVTYTGAGDVDSLLDPLNKRIRFGYDGNGMIATLTDPAGRATAFRVTVTNHKLNYDSLPGPATRRDTTFYRYQNYPGTYTMVLTGRYGVLLGDSVRIVYDSTFRRRPKQAVLATVKDETGASVHPTVTYVAYEGRGFGALVSLDSVYVEMKDPRNNWTRSLLNRWGESLRSWDAIGLLGRSSYTPEGLPLWSEGKNGDSSRVYHDYDSAHRLVRSYVCRGSCTGANVLRTDSLVYDVNHRVIKAVDARDSVSQFFYDAVGRDTLTVTPNAASVRTWYRTNGLVDSVRAAGETATTRITYDGTWSNVAMIRDATGDTITSNTYDSYGRLTRADRKLRVMLTSTTDTSQWRRSETYYNAANQVDSTRLSLSGRCKDTGGGCGSPTFVLEKRASVRFDAAGRDTASIGSNGAVTAYHFDLLGRLLVQIPPTDSSAVRDSMTYDVAGNLKKVLTRRGITIQHYYDSRNRDTLTTIPGVGDLKRTFGGPLDQLTRLWYANPVDSIGGVNRELRWAYDARGRLTVDSSYTGTTVRTATYAYDGYERPSTMTDVLGTWTTRYETARGMADSLITPYADTLAYTYDQQGRGIVSILQHGLSNRATVVRTFGANGKLTELINQATSTSGAYDTGTLSRPFATDTSTIALAPQWSQKFGFADGLNRTETDSLEYDALERLTLWSSGAKHGVGAETYDFDANDNISQATGAATYSTATDRLLARVNGAAADSFSYDRDGNMTRMHEVAGNNWDYGYDGLGQLVSVRRNGTLIARYAYDVAGRRIAKRVYSSASGGTVGYTRFSYHGDQVAFETDSAGTTIGLRYTWGMGTDHLMAVRDAAGNHFYPARDKLGSIRMVVKRDGTWVMAQRFTPYGGSASVDSATGGLGFELRYKWAGREYDAETGFYFLRARYYSPALRRFLAEDPVDVGNAYAYVSGAPLEAKDPSGLMMDYVDGLSANTAFRDAQSRLDALIAWGDGQWSEFLSQQADRAAGGGGKRIATVRDAAGNLHQVDCAKIRDQCDAFDAAQKSSVAAPVPETALTITPTASPYVLIPGEHVYLMGDYLDHGALAGREFQTKGHIVHFDSRGYMSDLGWAFVSVRRSTDEGGWGMGESQQMIEYRGFMLLSGRNYSITASVSPRSGHTTITVTGYRSLLRI